MITLIRRNRQIREHLVACGCLLAALAGCGGGGGETKTGSNGTGLAPAPTEVLAVAGPISALGPTGIGGTSVDDGTASIAINAGTRQPASSLRLGMFAEMGGTILADGSRGMASTASIQSVVVGPAGTVNPDAQQLTILSVRIQADQNTILDGLSALSGAAPGTRLEVHALNQPGTSVLRATRIVALPALPAAPTAVEILGAATGVTETSFSVAGVRVASTGSTFVVGGLIVLPSPKPPVSTLAENTRVRVIGTYDAATNTITATQVIGGLNTTRNDNTFIVLDGIVESVSAPGRFRLNETDVDAIAVGGSAVAAGTRVQLSGRKAAGVLTATKLKVVSASDRLEYIVQGPVSDFVSLAAFKVRGELIDASTASVSGGTAAELANGRQVLVKCGAGSGKLLATQVSLLP